MKRNILLHSIAALLVAAPFTRAEEKETGEKKDGGKTPPPVEEKKRPEKKDDFKSSSTAVVTSGDGTATVTIDINGKKETRTFKLGDGKNLFLFGKDGDGAKSGGAVGFGGGDFHPGFGHEKREKGPWIGIALEPVQEVVRAQLSLAPGEGIVASHVAPDSPAAKAGLQANDILLRFDDQILVEPAQLKKLIAMKKPGESVKLTYLRKGERKDAIATLAEHEFEPGEGHAAQWLQHAPGGFAIPGGPGWQSKEKLPGMDKQQLEKLQDQLRQLKEKQQGVVVDKRSWLSGAPDEMLKAQIEKLKQGLKDSELPREEAEKVLKHLEKIQHDVNEAMEKTRRNANEVMENARRIVEEASHAINNARRPHEKEKKEKGDQPKKSEEQPKKPGEPL